MNTLEDFLELVSASSSNGEFNKLTLSKNRDRSSTLVNIYVRWVVIKEEPQFSFTYRYKTQDKTSNLLKAQGLKEIARLLKEEFKNANLITTTQVHSLMTSKKEKVTIQTTNQKQTTTSQSHNREKKKFVKSDAQYLQELNVSDSSGKVIPKMADKYRQINKYLEIFDNLLSQIKLPNRPIKVVDMGSGKGYLTFALYDFLKNQKGIEAEVIGIELRKDLVDLCNNAARECSFDNLSFVDQRIENYEGDSIDILIALHACDTATDDAIGKGLKDKAELIVCAPCCHKQIRQQLKGKEQSDPILKYGIFKERQYEMVTDTIRALILEREGYESKVFEFISVEHTRKNVMLVGLNKHKPKSDAQDKITAIKEQYGIDFHYLEKQVNPN
ncbi:class I SAM-dependent methyltransferase [Reichenbachiella versicolor]|uniref:class I SAM-dependent methyltransferase n=1 Tax=Reichenbachiella versicolor TaxID=1821036 RepID=UPI000D6E5195|nr:SAM-dependent methyltransferase [Reichenbachiella versicolor]